MKLLTVLKLGIFEHIWVDSQGNLRYSYRTKEAVDEGKIAARVWGTTMKLFGY